MKEDIFLMNGKERQRKAIMEATELCTVVHGYAIVRGVPDLKDINNQSLVIFEAAV